MIGIQSELMFQAKTLCMYLLLIYAKKVTRKIKLKVHNNEKALRLFILIGNITNSPTHSLWL